MYSVLYILYYILIRIDRFINYIVFKINGVYRFKISKNNNNLKILNNLKGGLK